MKLNDIEKEYKKISKFISDYFEQTGLEYAILGLSGGIDSAVCATLLKLSLGKEKVIGVLMPSDVSTDSSITDAEELAENIGISTLKLPIHDTFATFKKMYNFSDLALENLQARIRGTLLMSLANTKNGLVVATGNKSEILTGYFTLYGDSVGAIAPISHLYKTQVYILANWLNDYHEAKFETSAIPINSITKEPSAELSANQKDSDSLGDYKTLDIILEKIIDNKESISSIIDSGFSKGYVQRVNSLIIKNEFKKDQLAKGV